MPLRDHFRSPVNDKHTWNELHGGWPMMIVRHLFDILPVGYVAAPSVHIRMSLDEQDEFEVRVYDTKRGRELVAAIEIVSPSNKDRPESRQAFTVKVAALIQKGVCVSIVDLVTIRHFNLYAELLELLGGTDPQLESATSSLYSVTIRVRKRLGKRSLIDMWYDPMTLGHPLPTLPVWLSDDRRVLLPLEQSYEETCRILHIS